MFSDSSFSNVNIFLFSSLLYDSEVIIFYIWRRHLGRSETVINIFHNFLTIYRPKNV